MSERVYTIGEISRMVGPILEQCGMEAAYLFGSYARGEADADSDIDVILVGRPGFKPLEVFGAAELLHRASGKRVDAYELSELAEGPFRDEVLSQAVRL